MTEIEDVYSQELPPDSIVTPATYNVSDAIGHGLPRTPIRGNLNAPWTAGASANPGGVPAALTAPTHYTISRALREGLTLTEAKRIAARAIELAADGSPRHMEYVRDTTEGKPGVRIADGEWDPAGAAVFQAMMALRAQSLGQLDGPAEDVDV